VKDEALQVDPFLTAYKYLEACLSQGAELCVVIGFSFRDAPINRILRLGLLRNPKLYLLIVDPKPDKRRITSDLGVDSSRMAFIEEPFEYYGMERNKLLNESIVERASPASIFHYPNKRTFVSLQDRGNWEESNDTLRQREDTPRSTPPRGVVGGSLQGIPGSDRVTTPGGGCGEC
jgi:hypothetical protein